MSELLGMEDELEEIEEVELSFQLNISEENENKNSEEEIHEEQNEEDSSTYEQKKQMSSSQYFPVQEHLENRYFPPDVLGFAKPSTGEAFINQDVYGPMKGVVKLHERLHLMYPHLNETSVRIMTNNLSGGPYIPTGMSY